MINGGLVILYLCFLTDYISSERYIRLDFYCCSALRYGVKIKVAKGSKSSLVLLQVGIILYFFAEIGVAMSTALSLSMCNILLYRKVKKALGIDPSFLYALKVKWVVVGNFVAG